MKTYSLNLLVIPTIVALLTGCGMASGKRADYAGLGTFSGMAAQGTGGPLTASGSSDFPGYTCPSQPNVLPDYDRNLDGTGRYKVCSNREKQDSLVVLGEMSTSKVYCIFPAEYVNHQYVFWKPDLRTGLPMSQCIEGSSDALFPEFSDLDSNFNAVFIVEQADRQKMEQCLVMANYYNCPSYSYGVFR